MKAPLIADQAADEQTGRATVAAKLNDSPRYYSIEHIRQFAEDDRKPSKVHLVGSDRIAGEQLLVVHSQLSLQAGLHADKRPATVLQA
jgi:hypothetical protein